jgi:hypothetical protein
MRQGDSPTRAVIGLVLGQPALHGQRRELLEAELSERRREIEIDGASVPSPSARSPAIGVGREPLLEELPHRGSARRDQLAID